MTALNTVLGALTGPRRLRSALRLKTVAISSLLVALDGPAELRVQIPAAVFGGDIFGVMSSQLRDALIVPPQSQVSPARPERRRLVGPSESPASNNFQTRFPLNAERATRATHRVSPVLEPTSSASLVQSESSVEKRSVPQFSPLEQGISLKGIDARLFGEALLASEKPSVVTDTPSITKTLTTRTSPLTPTLVSSLHRYWQTVREERNTRQSHQQHSTASATNAVDFPVTDSEQRTAPHSWPTAVGRDVSAKLRSFTDAQNPLQKSRRLSSTPERQIQNVFNIEVNQANQQSSGYDDLGDRLAQILHEQALQHGIDVT
jgi:hypothetical protein